MENVKVEYVDCPCKVHSFQNRVVLAYEHRVLEMDVTGIFEAQVVVVVVQDCVFDGLFGDHYPFVVVETGGEVDGVDVAEDVCEVGDEIVLSCH